MSVQTFGLSGSVTLQIAGRLWNESVVVALATAPSEGLAAAALGVEGPAGEVAAALARICLQVAHV